MKIAGKSLVGMGMMGLLAAVLAGAGCRSGSDRTASQAFSDRMTAHHVKKALNDAPVFKYPDVDVNAYNGNVQLTGYVQTDQQREDAARIAAQVPGVNQVMNDIMVKPTATGRPTLDQEGRETGHMQQAPIVQPNQPNTMPSQNPPPDR